jgi:hypothetical protein
VVAEALDAVNDAQARPSAIATATARLRVGPEAAPEA